MWYTGDHQEFSVSKNNFYRLLCCYIDVKNSNRENATEHNTNRDHGGLDQVIFGSFKIKSVQSQCSMNNNYCIDSKTYHECSVFTPISAAFKARKLISGANSSEYGNFSFVTAECGLVCHVKCSPNVPHTCGLPSQLVEHFTETLQEQKNDENSLIPNSQSTTKLGGRREGWLRVPRYAAPLAWFLVQNVSHCSQFITRARQTN